MPFFKAQTFRENVDRWLEGPARDELAQACEAYTELNTPQQQARCIQGMMEVLDAAAGEETRRAIMEACGRRCIRASGLQKARRLQREVQDLDDLLSRLNAVPLGGGHLRREGDVIHGAYDHCGCGSVSETRERLSATFCLCSCGWYRQLFETLLGRPVEVELLGSIVHGDDRCRFLIHIQKPRQTAG